MSKIKELGIKNVGKAVKEAGENLTGLYVWDKTENEIYFQPTLTKDSDPDMSDWEELGLVAIYRPNEFTQNKNEQKRLEELVTVFGLDYEKGLL